MKKILLVLMLCVFITPAYAGGVGYVDYNKIIDNFHFAKFSMHELDNKSQEMQNFLQKKADEFKTLETPVQKKKFEDEMQAEIKKREMAFNDFKEQKEKVINAKIKAAITTVRTSKGLDVVMNADNIYSGGSDITDEVIELLNK